MRVFQALGCRAWHWLVVALGVLAACSANGDAVYVAPAGNDSWPGTRTQPFATLGKAVAEARALPMDVPRVVRLRGGSYWNVSLAIGPEDSGLTIESEPGEEVVLYGGQRLTGWERDGDRWFASPLPTWTASDAEVGAELALRQWEVRLLLVNGETRPRARFPETGVLTHETRFEVPWMSSTGGGWQRKPTQAELTTLRYRPGDVPADLDLRNAEVTVFHMWDESCVGVAAHDAAAGVLTLAPELGHPPGAFGVRKMVIWNTREGLARPGQWYHDRPRNRIVYWPLPGEQIETAVVVVPTRTTIFRLAGTAVRPVRNVTLRGLRLAATTSPLLAGGFAAARFDGAISLDRAEDCTLDRLTIQGVAGHGINTRRQCVRTQVLNSEIADCGAGGVYVGGVSAVISNNHIHAVGRAYPSAIGIYRGGRDCRVIHNEVHDCPYSAINYGGTGNRIEHNLLYDCMKVLHDGAAIYMFAATNCVLRGNVTRDVLDTGGYGSSAYYLDERSTGCVVESNLSLRVARPMHHHMATNNVVRDNVFIVEGDARLTFPRSAEFTLERNILYATGRIRIENVKAVTRWSNNILYSGTGQFEGVVLRDYSAAGAEAQPPGDTLRADPLFRDWLRGDYRFRDDSPAPKLGIRPIDVSQVGRRLDAR